MLASASQSVRHTVYVSNERSQTVSVIDGTTDRVTATIPVGTRPRGVHVAPDGRRLYVALSDNAQRVQGSGDGIAVIESNYIACHPVCDGLVVTGLQDNGIIRRRSGAVWYHEGDGDGGGVAFDPTHPQRYLRQYTCADWDASDGNLAFNVNATENSQDHCSFYSTPAAIACETSAQSMSRLTSARPYTPSG